MLILQWMIIFEVTSFWNPIQIKMTTLFFNLLGSLLGNVSALLLSVGVLGVVGQPGHNKIFFQWTKKFGMLIEKLDEFDFELKWLCNYKIKFLNNYLIN